MYRYAHLVGSQWPKVTEAPCYAVVVTWQVPDKRNCLSSTIPYQPINQLLSRIFHVFGKVCASSGVRGSSLFELPENCRCRRVSGSTADCARHATSLEPSRFRFLGEFWCVLQCHCASPFPTLYMLRRSLQWKQNRKLHCASVNGALEHNGRPANQPNRCVTHRSQSLRVAALLLHFWWWILQLQPPKSFTPTETEDAQTSRFGSANGAGRRRGSKQWHLLVA